MGRGGNPKGYKPNERQLAALAKKGEVRNPYGRWGKNPEKAREKANQIKLISKAMAFCLANKIDPAAADLLGLDKTVSAAMGVAKSMVVQATNFGDVPAAKELREVTEGKLPESMMFAGKIDYAAGQAAKEQIIAKLGKPKKEENK